jgi:hypothetical protein
MTARTSAPSRVQALEGNILTPERVPMPKMISNRRPLLAVAAALAVGTLLSACVVAPYDPYYRGGYSRYGGGEAYGNEPVTAAPPPPQYEVVGVAPAPGYIWIGGFWNWVGGRHVWIGGRWAAGRPGHSWVPHRWYRAGPGWRAAPGHWR